MLTPNKSSKPQSEVSIKAGKSKFYFGLIILANIFSFSIKMDAQSTDSPPWAWVKTLSATHGIYGYSIVVDPNGSGDIYLSGGFEGTTDFDPGPGTFNLSSGTSSDVGIFIAKYDGNGNFVWAKSMVGVAGSAASPRSMAIDFTGSKAIYTTGRFQGTVDFDPGTETFKLKAVGNNDIFISKLDNEGNFLWSKAMGGPGDDSGSFLAIDLNGSGDIYLTGQFKRTVDFDSGLDTLNLTSAGDYDIFISRLSSSGNFLWTKQIGGTGSDSTRAIAMDPAGNGNVYIRGSFEDIVDFDPGANTHELTAAEGRYNFISVIDSSGNFLWAAQMGKAGNGFFEGSLALDPAGSGDVYITGSFNGTCDFDPEDETFNLTSAGSSDIFITKLSDSGYLTWAKAMGGTSQDYGATVVIQPGNSGNVYTMGTFTGLADFEPGSGSVEISSAGEKDIFISALDNSGNFKWVKAIKGPANAYGNSIAIDNQFLYVTGAFFGSSISFDSTTIPNNNTIGTDTDLFFGKLDIAVATADFDSKKQQLKLYPNPASNTLTIDLGGNEFSKGDITLFNVMGETVYYIPNESVGQKKTIDISTLPTGIYFVEVNFDGERVVRKIVKE